MAIREASLSLTFCAVLLTAACETTADPAPQLGQSAPSAFIEAACGGCHAVEPPFFSPNPDAPTFESIANREGLSDDTLADWLKDAHNYPEVMDFDLEPDQVEEIARYMITLRREDYEPDQ